MCNLLTGTDGCENAIPGGQVSANAHGGAAGPFAAVHAEALVFSLSSIELFMKDCKLYEDKKKNHFIHPRCELVSPVLGRCSCGLIPTCIRLFML